MATKKRNPIPEKFVIRVERTRSGYTAHATINKKTVGGMGKTLKACMNDFYIGLIFSL